MHTTIEANFVHYSQFAHSKLVGFHCVPGKIVYEYSRHDFFTPMVFYCVMCNPSPVCFYSLINNQGISLISRQNVRLLTFLWN